MPSYSSIRRPEDCPNMIDQKCCCPNLPDKHFLRARAYKKMRQVYTCV